MKRKTIIALILLLVGVSISALYGPWWAPSIIVISIVALLPLSTRPGILLGSMSIGIVFLGMALVLIANDHAEIISGTGKMLGGLSSLSMILITTLLGVVTGGLSGWVGSVLGNHLSKK
jgi:hypothetical protein